jgi:hypothetical protein
LAPALRGLLQFVETARKYLSGDTGEKAGETIGNGLVKGIANVISGPLLLGLGVVLGKVLIRIGATLKQEASALFQINSASKARAVTQERINFLLKVATQEELAQINTARTVLAQKEALLAVQARYNRELLVGTELQNALIGRGSFGVGKRAGLGKVPGFADPIASAIAKEASVSGLPKSQIYVDRDPRVANFANPAGLLVANRRDEPLGGYQGVNRVISQGGNPKKGSIPGFAKTPLQSQSEIVARRLGIGDIRYDEGIAKTIKAAKAVTSFDAALARSSSIQDQLNNKNIELTRKLSLVNKGFEGLAKEIAAGKPRELNIVGGQSQFATFVPTPSGTIDTSRAIMDRNIARKNAGVEKKVPFGPAFPINPALQSRLEQANLARQGIIPEKAYSSPIGPPSRVEFARAQAIRQAELRQRMSSLVDAANVRKEQAAKTQRETLLAAQEKKSGLRRNIAFGAALALPAAAGFIPEGKGGTAGGIVSGALSGAAQGSTLGIFGPQAAVVGIALGGLAGIISKTTKSFEELSAELGNARAAEKQQTQTLGQLADLQDSIQEAMLSGDRGLASKLSDQVRGILSNKDTPDDVRKTFASLAGDPTKLREAVSKGGSQTTRNEIKDSAILAFKEFSDVGSSLFGTSKDETKDLAKALASQAASIGVGSEGFGVKSVSDFYKLLGTLGVDVPKTASVSLESMLKVTAQAREEYDKNAAAAAAAGKSLKSFELGLIDIGRSVRNASFGDSLSRQSFLGRSERGQIRAKGEIGILSASATTNQAIDLRAVLEQSQLIASNADQNNSLENDLRNVLRTEIGKKPNLSLNERALLGDSGTSTAQLRQLATNANMTGPNSEIGKATEEYNQKLELNTRALNESLLTLKTKTEVEKRETEALRKRLAFSGGSVQRASEEAYGLSRLGRYGERTPSKKIAEDESFVSFFEKQQSLSGNTSSLQGDYEKALSRLNKQKFLTEQASALEGVYGRPLNLRNPDGTVRESGIKYAAEGASRFQDPRKANIGKYVLENLRSQNANITDAGSSQKRINDIINAGKKPALNPEELLSKTTEANLSLQKTLEAFNNASKDFTLTINTNLSVLQDNSTNFDSSEFANLIKGQVETIAGELLSLKGKVNDKPVPPTSVTKSSPNYASPEMRAIYQK